MARIRLEESSPTVGARAEVEKAHGILVELVAELTGKIAAIPPDAAVRMADGKSLSGREIQSLWDEITFEITTRNFGPGYGGSFDYESKTSFIRADTITGWDQHPSGAEFITLHELIHSCEHGEAVRQTMWRRYYDENKHVPGYLLRYRETPEFSEVEEYCYCGARAIMEAMQIPAFTGQFAHGYEYGDLDR